MTDRTFTRSRWSRFWYWFWNDPGPRWLMPLRTLVAIALFVVLVNVAWGWR